MSATPENVPTRLAAFAAVIGLAFGAAALAGAAIDPTDREDVVAGAGHDGVEEAHGSGGGGRAALSGLAVSRDGYTLEPDRTHFAREGRKRFTFRIVDAHGRVVRDEYELEADRELHLVVVRHDTATYEHVHPRKGEDGTWSVDLALSEPGVYRAYADFQTDGKKRVLGTDLFVPGDFTPRPLPQPESVTEIDGYSIEVAASQPLEAGQVRTLTFSIRRGESPVEALQPYLGSRGHLVALREGDLGYLHVHPDESVGDNAVEFGATFPTAGRYRLFFQFKTGGDVRTVAYTIEVPR